MKKYTKTKKLRIHIKRKFIVPFLNSLRNLIYRWSNKLRDKLLRKIIHLENEYTRVKCSMIECSVCGKKDWLGSMNGVYRNSGLRYYCHRKECQERFMEDAGDVSLESDDY